MPVTRLSVLTYITPVIAVLLGMSVAHEALAATTLPGALLVLIGVWLVNRPHFKAPAPELRQPDKRL